MICNKCGKENNEGSKFCMWCGESLQTTGELNNNTDNTIVEEKTNNIEVNNNEPRKNKGKGLVIALIIVLVLIVGISGFLLGRYSVDKKDTGNNDIIEEEKKEEHNDTIEEENDLSNVSEGYIPNCLDDLRKKNTLTTDIDETKYNNISEYIYQQNNVKINWEYCVLIQDGDYTTLDKPKYELTEIEKNNVLEEIKNSTYSIMRSGIGGACMSNIKITYERNNQQYYIDYTPVGNPRYVMFSNDGNVYKILDKVVTNTLEYPDSCMYVFDNLSSTADSLLEQLQG